MRKIYKHKSLKSELTQGSIINNCVATDYEGCEVFGCIVTPRCDMAHGLKVPTVHYLPIVQLKDWYDRYGIYRLIQNHQKNQKGNFSQKCNSLIGINLTEMQLSTDEMAVYISNNTTEKKKNDLLDSLSEYNKSLNIDKSTFIPRPKDKNSLIGELMNNKLAGFYPIEDWETIESNSESKWRVIVLRDIHALQKEIALRLSSGFTEEEYDKEYLKQNGLSVSDDNSNTYYSLCEINSPYIEHIMQAFSHNFCRIGVDDIPDNDIINLAQVL